MLQIKCEELTGTSRQPKVKGPFNIYHFREIRKELKVRRRGSTEIRRQS